MFQLSKVHQQYSEPTHNSLVLMKNIEMTNFMCSVKKQRYSHRTLIKKDGKLKDEEAILSTKGRWLKRTKNRNG